MHHHPSRRTNGHLVPGRLNWARSLWKGQLCGLKHVLLKFTEVSNPQCDFGLNFKEKRAPLPSWRSCSENFCKIRSKQHRGDAVSPTQTPPPPSGPKHSTFLLQGCCSQGTPPLWMACLSGEPVGPRPASCTQCLSECGTTWKGSPKSTALQKIRSGLLCDCCSESPSVLHHPSPEMPILTAFFNKPHA